MIFPSVQTVLIKDVDCFIMSKTHPENDFDSEFDYDTTADLDEDTKEALRGVLDGLLDTPVSKAEDFDWDEFKRWETMKAVMMPSELFWNISIFERSFTQTVGQYGYERFAQVIAENNSELGDAELQHTMTVDLTDTQLSEISKILDTLETGGEPDWEKEASRVMNPGFDGDFSTVRLTWDLHIEEFEDGRPLFVEIKSPKPNKDQTRAAKQKMLRTVAGFAGKDVDPIVKFAFPFNPYGSISEYDHWPTEKFFDVSDTDSMLIADDFWDSLGGENTLDGLIKFLIEEPSENLEKLRDIVDQGDF